MSNGYEVTGIPAQDPVPDPPRFTGYVDASGLPRWQVDLPIPEHPTNPGLAALGIAAIFVGVGLLAASTCRPSAPSSGLTPMPPMMALPPDDIL